MSARDTWDAVLEPQAIGLLCSNVSIYLIFDDEKASYPCDVVVSIHDTAYGIDNENHHEDQPVRKIVQAVSLHVGRDKGAECDESSRLFESAHGYCV